MNCDTLTKKKRILLKCSLKIKWSGSKKLHFVWIAFVCVRLALAMGNKDIIYITLKRSKLKLSFKPCGVIPEPETRFDYFLKSMVFCQCKLKIQDCAVVIKHIKHFSSIKIPSTKTDSHAVHYKYM
jgi:hypothetical protein